MPTPLPVIEILRDTLQFVWEKKAHLLRALAVPVVIMIAVAYLFNFADDNPLQWVEAFFSMAIYVLFAVTCHRLALLGDQGVPQYGLLKWTQRETRFYGWGLLLMILFLVPFWILNLIVANFFIPTSATQLEEFDLPRIWFLFYLSSLPLIYSISRLTVVYPATALERQVNLKWAWNLTRDNGWRLTLVVGMPPIIFTYAETLLLREQITSAEEFIVMLFRFVLLAVEIVALSFSYKHLTSQEEQVSHV